MTKKLELPHKTSTFRQRQARRRAGMDTPLSRQMEGAVSDVPDKLREHVMRGKTARAISGRDLALLISQRLTDPGFQCGTRIAQDFSLIRLPPIGNWSGTWPAQLQSSTSRLHLAGCDAWA